MVNFKKLDNKKEEKLPEDYSLREKSLAEITKEYIEEEKEYRRGAISIKDLISPTSFQVHPSYLLLGDKYVRTIFVITYPRYISVGWFAPVINLNSTFDV